MHKQQFGCQRLPPRPGAAHTACTHSLHEELVAAVSLALDVQSSLSDATGFPAACTLCRPANILFNAFGEVKIADFGLSKVVEEGQTRGMELTSQGVGTYW